MDRKTVCAVVIGLIFFTLPAASQVNAQEFALSTDVQKDAWADADDNAMATPSPHTAVAPAQNFIAGQSALLAQSTVLAHGITKQRGGISRDAFKIAQMSPADEDDAEAPDAETSAEAPAADTEAPAAGDSFEAPAAENQIVVTYKPGQSPHQLRKKHDDRVAYQNSFIGAIVLFFRSLIDTIQNNPLPAHQINRIEEAEKNAGVEAIVRTVEAPDMDESETYLMTISDSGSVEQAISIFTELPEVEDAQPNYEYTIQ